jgi:hypothetical protein
MELVCNGMVVRLEGRREEENSSGSDPRELREPRPHGPCFGPVRSLPASPQQQHGHTEVNKNRDIFIDALSMIERSSIIWLRRCGRASPSFCGSIRTPRTLIDVLTDAVPFPLTQEENIKRIKNMTIILLMDQIRLQMLPNITSTISITFVVSSGIMYPLHFNPH